MSRAKFFAHLQESRNISSGSLHIGKMWMMALLLYAIVLLRLVIRFQLSLTTPHSGISQR